LEFPGYGYRRVTAELRRQHYKVNHVWVADITYIRLPTGFVYLACVLDAWSRRCVRWKLSRSIDSQLTLAALANVWSSRARFW
jgi:transposase InsO family protein